VQKPAQPAAPAAPLTYAERLKQGKAAAKAPAAPNTAPTPTPMQQTQASEAPEATTAGKAANASEDPTANGGRYPPPPHLFNMTDEQYSTGGPQICPGFPSCTPPPNPKQYEQICNWGRAVHGQPRL